MTMTITVKELEPKCVWSHFSALNSVPRASKNEEGVVDFIKSFGERLGLVTVVDKVGNVVIKKPAAKGKEGHAVVALQGHLDMVCQKNKEVEFDFNTQGIDMYVDGDWVRARGTTLGADNGIGVAAIMAVLESTDISHPPLEALFTVDEEVGMTGAKALRNDALQAKYLLNLDSEEDDVLTIGCAGGVDISGEGVYVEEPAPKGLAFYRLALSGLTGGHSGIDIHLGRANANKLMNRLLQECAAAFGIRLVEVEGGGLRNAIPRESWAIIGVPVGVETEVQQWVAEQEQVLRDEYKTTDPELGLVLERWDSASLVVSSEYQARLFRGLYAVPDGIFRLSPEVEGLVQTSNNLARVQVRGGRIAIGCLTRGSVDSEKDYLARAVEIALAGLGLKVVQSGEYPGWAPNPESELVRLVGKTYKDLFGETPKVAACHAGLECGILGRLFPGMEMISFGPTIVGAHSPDEAVRVSSVQKFWRLLRTVLERI